MPRQVSHLARAIFCERRVLRRAEVCMDAGRRASDRMRRENEFGFRLPLDYTVLQIRIQLDPPGTLRYDGPRRHP